MCKEIFYVLKKPSIFIANRVVWHSLLLEQPFYFFFFFLSLILMQLNTGKKKSKRKEKSRRLNVK